MLEKKTNPKENLENGLNGALGKEGPHKRSALGGEHRIVRKH